MNHRRLITGQRLAALFLIGCLLFNYPILSLFSRDARLWGVPALYVYIFISWAALIGLMAMVIELRRK
ncbi:MAG: hypothetical protein H6645_11410 [Caldilineaceae bacterium]|nr:hypothetical protein [Caldilineaceae bacterium]MCB9157709.1 hypothetical protein [Caldilineaceae bacterium]